jgi:hypothetical protein
MAYCFLTRLNVGDYEAWKPMFNQDGPGARAAAKQHTLLRDADSPGEVFILVEFDTEAKAREGREKLVASGVLERFPDKDLPRIVEVAETKTR